MLLQVRSVVAVVGTGHTRSYYLQKARAVKNEWRASTVECIYIGKIEKHKKVIITAVSGER